MKDWHALGIIAALMFVAATITGTRAQSITPERIMTTEERLAHLERRVAALEGTQPGYVCVGCGLHQPRDHYFYTARNSETNQVITPLCAPCVRGGLPDVMGKSWRHQGPLKQT